MLLLVGCDKAWCHLKPTAQDRSTELLFFSLFVQHKLGRLGVLLGFEKAVLAILPGVWQDMLRFACHVKDKLGKR